MNWWKVSRIPDDERFWKIIKGFVLECPSSIKKTPKTGKGIESKSKYIPVSNRNLSFRYRNISHNLLTTLLCQLRKDLQKKSTYICLEASDDFQLAFDSLMKNNTFQDNLFELMIFRKRNDMSDTEAIYYAIRNSFAHGSFEVIEKNNKRVYLLESVKNGQIMARMRLNETTLINYIELSNLSVDEIKSYGKYRK